MSSSFKTLFMGSALSAITDVIKGGRTKVSNADAAVREEGCILAKELMLILEYIPVYNISTAELVSFMSECATFCARENINYEQILSAYVSPYEEFIVKFDDKILLMYDCPISGMSGGRALYITNLIGDTEYLATDVAIINRTNECLNVAINSTQMLDTIGLKRQKDILSKDIGTAVASWIIELCYLFAALRVFATFIPAGKDGEKNSSGKKSTSVSYAKQHYRYMKHTLTKSKLIEMGIKNHGKRWKLKYCCDVPTVYKYLRHRKYRFDKQGNELPLSYDINNKAYYKKAVVPSHQRGKGLPKRVKSATYKL